jgi:LPXTG-motif cell wall-anchored protein
VKRLIAAAVMATVLMAAPAAAQQYPPAVNSLTVSDTTPAACQTIGIEGRTFAPGASVAVSLASRPADLGTAAAGPDGVFRFDATIPDDTPVGSHTITAAGQAPDGSQLTLSVSIEVVDCDSTGTGSDDGDDGADGGTLPNTGNDSSLPLARIGLALAAIGGVITAVAAKRRKAVASPA